MSNHATFAVQEGENGIVLEFEIQKRKDTDPDTLEPLPLTGATVTMRAEDETFPCAVTNEAGGIAARTWAAGDLIPGVHECQVVVSFVGGNVLKGPRFYLDVEPQVVGA